MALKLAGVFRDLADLMESFFEENENLGGNGIKSDRAPVIRGDTGPG